MNHCKRASYEWEIEISPAMVHAGVEAFLAWDYETEEIEAMVFAVYNRMAEANQPTRR